MDSLITDSVFKVLAPATETPLAVSFKLKHRFESNLYSMKLIFFHIVQQEEPEGSGRHRCRSRFIVYNCTFNTQFFESPQRMSSLIIKKYIRHSSWFPLVSDSKATVSFMTYPQKSHVMTFKVYVIQIDLIWCERELYKEMNTRGKDLCVSYQRLVTTACL